MSEATRQRQKGPAGYGSGVQTTHRWPRWLVVAAMAWVLLVAVRVVFALRHGRVAIVATAAIVILAGAAMVAAFRSASRE
jgi:hypothetical protein